MSQCLAGAILMTNGWKTYGYKSWLRKGDKNPSKAFYFACGKFLLKKILGISKQGPGKSLNFWPEKVYEPWDNLYMLVLNFSFVLENEDKVVVLNLAQNRYFGKTISPYYQTNHYSFSVLFLYLAASAHPKCLSILYPPSRC